MSENSVVYYLLFGNRIKIGTTKDLPERLKALPYDLVLATEPGGLMLEKERHRQFKHFRVKNEWFVACPEILSFVATLQAKTLPCTDHLCVNCGKSWKGMSATRRDLLLQQEESVEGSDIIEQFISECLDVNRGVESRASTSEIFNAYQAWAKEKGYPRGSQRSLTEVLQKKGLNYMKSHMWRGFPTVRVSKIIGDAGTQGTQDSHLNDFTD